MAVRIGIAARRQRGVTAAALVDRLVHHCHVVNIRGNSCRLRAHADLARRLHGAGAGAALPAAEPHPPQRVKDRTPEALAR